MQRLGHEEARTGSDVACRRRFILAIVARRQQEHPHGRWREVPAGIRLRRPLSRHDHAHERAPHQARPDSRGIHREDSRSRALGDVGRERPALGVPGDQGSREEEGSLRRLPGHQPGVLLLDGADAAVRAASSGVPGEGRRLERRVAEDQELHRRTAAPSLARGAGGDRGARRRPPPMGDRKRRVHLRKAREPFHRRPRQYLHAHAARDRVARPRIALGYGARAGAAEACPGRARPDRCVPDHLGRLRRHREKAGRAARADGDRPSRPLRHVEVHVERGHHRLPVQAARQDHVPLPPEGQPAAGRRRQEDLMRRLAAGAALLLACASAWPQAFPSKPILVVSTASPGSSGDAALRMMAAKMTASLGQPVVVELKTAARGAQAAQALAKAAPDGYTITYGTSGTFVNARFLYKNLAFDVLKDFAPISLAVSSPSYVVVNASIPVSSLKELIDYAKRNPGKLEYASTGVGSVFHLTGESLKLYAGIDLLHVPYAQANFSQMINDWASGRVALWFPTYAFLAPNLANKVKPLAIVDARRSSRLPDLPTVAEVIPGFQGFPAWWAFFGPAGLPSPIAERLSNEVRSALKAPDVQPKLNDLGLATLASTPHELAAHLKREIDAVGALTKAIGLEPE